MYLLQQWEKYFISSSDIDEFFKDADTKFIFEISEIINGIKVDYRHHIYLEK